MPRLVEAARVSGASLLIIQEMGRVEAEQFFAALGPGWRYDRAGLNVVGWTEPWTWQASHPVNLSSFGQMQRTLLTVTLTHPGGMSVRVASTHLAAGASDLSPEAAVEARLVQAGEVAAALATDPLPTVLGADWNSRPTDPEAVSPRAALGAGWTFDQTDITHDAKRGIDGTACNYGATITTSTVVDLDGHSDHDGRRLAVQLTTT